MENSHLSGHIFIIALIALLFSVSFGTMANPVDVERARTVANTFLINNNAPTFGLREVSNESGFSNMYVFTTENSFVLIAADDRVQPVLGYSLNGRFDFENMPINKRAWIQEYNVEIQYAIEHQTRASHEVTQQWRELMEGNSNACRAILVVAPLLQTQWNQGSPYNMLCPSNSVTGCVATAMAQVMKYWNYPQHGIGFHSYVHPDYGELTADFQSTTYDWDNMLNTYSGSSTYAQEIAVATLMYHCGVSVDMNYSPNTSYAYNSYVADALKIYFNYSSEAQCLLRSGYSDTEWIAMLKADLDLGRPVQYFGSRSGDGHSFVCDGYNNSDYFHFNWGWGGYCDEYYTINNLNPGPGGIGSGSTGVYNNNQGGVFGVRPSECSADVPTNLTYTQNGRNVVLSWLAANDATSYNIYRNSNFIGNVSSTTYTDLASFGNSTYFVRSVDANGRLSLSSNAVTAMVPYQTPVVDDLTATLSGNNVNLEWTAPEWCYPQTPTTTLSYGDGIVNYSWNSVYYAHRHLAANLSQYAGKSVYKVSTYIQYPGTYSLYIYTKSTSNNQPNPDNLAFNIIGRVVTGFNVWYEFDIDNPIILTGTDDLWVVMKQENTGQNYPTPSFDIPSHNINALYEGSSPTNLHDANSNYNCSWFINTYLTDGTYSYNIYRDGTNIANNIHNTTYHDTNLSLGNYNYYVKTNYYAGETSASNQVSVQISDINYYNITVSANPSYGGTVSGGGTIQEGHSCTVTATPNANYTFNNWTENGTVVSSNANYNFIVTGNRTLVAHFIYVPPTYTVSVSANPTNGGSVSGGGTYTEGQSCTVTATPNTNYTFTNWTENGTVVSSNASYNFIVTGNRTLVAHFTYVPPTYIVSVSANPNNGGNVSGGGTYTEGQTCTVTATPNTNYTFTNWTENGTVVSSNASYNFIVTGNRTLVAHFTYVPPTYTVIVSANPNNGGRVRGGGTYQQGESCTVIAVANNGYTFENWTENGTVVSADTRYTFTVNANRNLIAIFSADPVETYTITATVDPVEGGTVIGAGTYEYGSQATLKVIPNENYTFKNWTENGIIVSEEQEYSFTVTGDRNLVATLLFFDGMGEQTKINITIFPNPAKDKLIIEVSAPINLIEIYNINGALMYRQKNCSEIMEINVENYAVGTYMIRLFTEDAVVVRRFVRE